MSTTGPTPLPPTTLNTSHSIPQSEAHTFLTAYLDRATSDPSLQPNSVLSEQGPISRNTTAAPSLVLHNLKRVQAGLAGEVLGKDLELEMFESEQEQARRKEGKWFEEEIAAFGGGKRGKRRGAQEEEEGWEDKRVWEEEQKVEEGNAAGDGEVGADDEVIEVGEDGMPPKIDKEERKRKKKEKRKAEKRAKATKD